MFIAQNAAYCYFNKHYLSQTVRSVILLFQNLY